MEFRKIATTTVDGVKRFARLERVLAAVCILAPAFMILFDGGPIKPSISHYYQMKYNQVYYFPMTMLAMLFIVNGVVKSKHPYNTFLGVMLVGVILFDRDAARWVHWAFAIAFFGGNAAVIVLFTSREERWFKVLLVVGIVASMIACFFLKWFSLFWAEWLSFAIIAFHYILESWGVVD